MDKFKLEVMTVTVNAISRATLIQRRTPLSRIDRENSCYAFPAIQAIAAGTNLKKSRDTNAFTFGRCDERRVNGNRWQ